MARDSKIQVGAINIRISKDKNRDYDSLLDYLFKLRRGIQVFGESYLAISSFNTETRIGVFSKYTEIDINGDWFDLDKFSGADPEKLESISVPERLKPNHSQFFFFLDPKIHVIIFSTYTASKALSARSVERFFKNILSSKEIYERFGIVESDIIKSYDEVERILSLSDLKELRVIIRPPNSDDVGEDLAHVIEKRLREQNGGEYEETLRAKGGGSLHPDQQTKKLASVAAENGRVIGKSVINGALTVSDTANSPLIETTTYKPDQAELVIFMGIARKLLQKISVTRRSLNG